MKRGTVWALTVSAVVALTALSGCGGGDGLLGGPGSVEVFVDWLGDAGDRAAAPPRQVSIEARFLDVNLEPVRELGVEVLNFPEDRLRLNRIPVGDYALQLVGYPEPNAQGGAQRVACVHVRVDPGGRVRLEVTLDRPPHAITFWPDPLRMKTGETRQVLTNVVAQDGQTVILGGLGPQFDFTILKGAPNLSVGTGGRVRAAPSLLQLPYVGRLFASHRDSAATRELVVFVTPRIVGGD